MRAVRFHGKEDLRIDEIPEPTPGPGQVKLRNAWSGICGSDLHIYYHPEALGLAPDKPHPLTGATLPQVLGHEFAGEVVEVGDDVTGVAPGDRVVVWPVYHCGECDACEAGLPNACRVIAFHGIQSDGGGMAEYTVVPASLLHRLPDGVPLEMGALVEPMAVAWHAVKRGGAEPGHVALVAGSGPIGIGVFLALRARGIEKVIVSEPSAQRRAAVERLGAEHVVDPTSEDLAARVAEVSGGRGVDVAFDAAGAGPAVSSALANLATRGTLVIIAGHERPMEWTPSSLLSSEAHIVGTLAYLPEDFDEVIEAMAEGKYSAEGWVESIGYEAAPAAIGRLRAGEALKILVGASG